MASMNLNEGMKFRIDESLYVIDALQHSSLSNSIFLSPLDETQTKIACANVKVLTRSELMKKLINNEASFYDSNTYQSTVESLLSDEQIKNQEMWHNFVEEHITRHSKNLTKVDNIDESRMLFDWNKYGSSYFCRSTCQAKVKAYIDSNRNPRKLINLGAVSRKGKARFTQDTEDLINDFFTDNYLIRSDRTAKSVNKIADLIRSKVTQLNKVKPDKYPKVPSKASIYRRLKDLEAELIINKTLSKQQNKLLRYKLGREFIGENPFERIEMDAIYINLGINNESGAYLGTLVVMVAIDTCTRCIVGYSVSVGKKVSESADLAIECLKSIIARKENIYWPCHGVPVKLITDATTAAIGNAYKIMALELGVTPIITVSGSPWKKPFIESFFRTLRREFLAKLPGYLGSKTRVNNTHLEQGETAESHAVMTLQEFDEELQKFITGTYHKSGHGGLNQRSPIDFWHKKVSKNPLLICEPNPQFTPDKFRGGVSMNHTLYKNGSIKLKNEQYASSELKELSVSGVEKVDCFYSNIDTSSIVVKANEAIFVVPIRAGNPHIEAGTQQAELDTARINQFSESDVSPRQHYTYQSGKKTKEGLQSFKKVKAKKAEKKEQATGRKQPKRTKVDNGKSIKMNSSKTHEQIMNAINSVEIDDTEIPAMPEFNVGVEL
ncbi:transposase family protein [Pseudoalteromonas sp. SWYJ118]|uniref:DDE-type integrase/transposase/recombinase n=1 Tax=Pseudoalteromonas sp. SWYJ118 TaxID=2792062 RepID=UPI0018CD93D8|nr:DDE-type integrase/transposase/recombinase [Pseudoalteromonas sp. SWYJ118]MBH0074771.1 transposase family protein [Pseudoalteromonas sp. SWYJ118]